jgi:aspartyl-tRNA(Asn)/glutamyl-tRNA(Gln) amidotransferase subunit A
MTRSVADAARMLTVIAEPDARDWQSLPAPAEGTRRDFSVGLEGGVRRLRIAFSPTLGYAKVDPEIHALVTRAVQVLADLGALVEEVDPGFFDPAPIFEAHWHSGAAILRQGIARDKWPQMDPGFHRLADQGAALAHMDYLDAVNQRGALGNRMAVFHQKYDVLLTPTLPIPAFEVNRVTPAGMDQCAWTAFMYPFNLTQQPAASVPCGLTAEGLPAGLQIVAAKYRDDLVLRVARAYESAAPFARVNLKGID